MTTSSNRRLASRATMCDVARLAGVSIKAVSRVVNDEPGVHEETAERVPAAIERLGFRRNFGALNLRRGSSTGTIGLVLEDVANPFCSGLTRAAEEVARRHGRQVLTGSSDEDAGRKRELSLEFCARRVDGLVVVPAGRQHAYLVAMGPHTAAELPAVLAGFLGGASPATAVITGNNRITVLVLRALAGAPRNPALVGFDGFELADLLDPPVTVVALDPGLFGQAAAELLFARLDGDTSPPRRIVLPVRLVPRGSGEVGP